MRAMNARYFSARTAKTKRLRREDIARLRDELAELLNSDRGLPETDAKLMAAWDPFDQNAAAPFFDPEWMFGLSSRFDLVIGNPPYVRRRRSRIRSPRFGSSIQAQRLFPAPMPVRRICSSISFNAASIF